MAARARGRATYEDLLMAPRGLVAELIDGELYTWPRPSGRHVRVSSRLGAVLTNAFDFGNGGPGGWWILDEPELHLGANVMVPDIAGWRREHMPAMPDDHRFRITPDWVCEILSPSTTQFDLRRKLPIYADHGVPYTWVIDPLSRTLQVFTLESEHWLLAGVYGGEDKIRAVPFDAIEIDLTSIWGPDSPPAP
ncbi:MAG TPA: Uma2 family endonuclease [Thermoanaerobaculia bacterium]|jgi:Uma2 family endonuclease|nr:Uma2 family endonuclease [Thermoanaerobaculia bacterium]